jgi:hypothetical protein
VAGQNVGKERLRIEGAAERFRDKLVVELEKICTKLAACAGKGVKVVEIEVHNDGDSSASQSQYNCNEGQVAVWAYG